MINVKFTAHLGGVEVTNCTADRTIRVRIPTYPHRVCGPSDGMEGKDVFGRPGARAWVGLVR